MEQQNLIYKTKYQQMLEGELVKATIAGEEFTLKHIDKTKDVPSGRKALNDALILMKEKVDWDNLPNLIKGLRSAGATLSPFYRMQVLRRLGKAGRQDVIIECLRRVSDTDLNLNDRQNLQQSLWWMQFKAITSEWDREQTSKALSWSEMIMDMLEDPKHHGSAGVTPNRHLPEINGILLQLAAARAEKHLGGTDVDGRVDRWARKLVSGNPKFDIEIIGTKKQKASKNHEWVCKLVPVLHGLKVAQRVLEPSSELIAPLKKMEAEIEKLLPNLLKGVKRHVSAKNQGLRADGVWLHETLLGSEPS
jgi:hypothetical protein